MRAIRFLTLALAVLCLGAALLFGGVQPTTAAEKEKPVKRDYSRVIAAPAPATQTIAEMQAKSDGCYSCHVKTDAPTGIARIYQVQQSVGLSRCARGMRRVSLADYRGGRAFAHGNRRDAVGRGGL